MEKKLPTDKEKEPEPAKTDSPQGKSNEPQKQVEETDSNTAPKEGDQSQEQSRSTKADAAPEKGDESQKQADGTETATSQGKGEETPSSVDIAPQNVTVQQEPAKFDPTLVMDSTSVVEIRIVTSSDDGALLGKADLYTDVLLLSDEIFPKDLTTDPERLEFGKNRILEFHRLWNKAHNLTQSTLAKYAILLGEAVLQIRKVVIRSGGAWEDWMAKNFRSIHPRTLQRYIQLAMREDCHEFAYLGVERLIFLVRVTQADLKYDKYPIRTLMGEYGIEHEEDSATTIAEFIEGIDAAIAARRLAKRGIKVDFAKMRRFIRFGGRVTEQMIAELNAIKEDPARVSQSIEAAIASQGKFPKTAVTEKLHFSSVMDRTTRIIGEVIKDTALVQQLDLQEIITLEEKLAELKRMIPTN
jgi:hypothetical protein